MHQFDSYDWDQQGHAQQHQRPYADGSPYASTDAGAYADTNAGAHASTDASTIYEGYAPSTRATPCRTPSCASTWPAATSRNA